MEEIVDFDNFDFEESEPKKIKNRMQKFKDFFTPKCPHCDWLTWSDDCPKCGKRTIRDNPYGDR
ncbi:unnamed protein product [marine sediment metagenome]|uniref:Uncharacterized protein n=1 Tax=marine sediment metagenome TaxID=412755 RepID=X0WS47_9ZZZZ